MSRHLDSECSEEEIKAECPVCCALPFPEVVHHVVNPAKVGLQEIVDGLVTEYQQDSKENKIWGDVSFLLGNHRVFADIKVTGYQNKTEDKTKYNFGTVGLLNRFEGDWNKYFDEMEAEFFISANMLKADLNLWMIPVTAVRHFVNDPQCQRYIHPISDEKNSHYILLQDVVDIQNKYGRYKYGIVKLV